ncbi:MAG: hypothetical protein ACLPIC_16920 [Rhodoblastus sp.]|uniref:hypothetical protein n=1 Tax=Rhodoblastus sp. TaxID=1962975 RepID=UPI003F96106C
MLYIFISIFLITFLSAVDNVKATQLDISSGVSTAVVIGDYGSIINPDIYLSSTTNPLHPLGEEFLAQFIVPPHSEVTFDFSFVPSIIAIGTTLNVSQLAYSYSNYTPPAYEAYFGPWSGPIFDYDCTNCKIGFSWIDENNYTGFAYFNNYTGSEQYVSQYILSIFTNDITTGITSATYSITPATSVSFTAVPEMSTWFMFLLGFSSLGFVGYLRPNDNTMASEREPT